MTTIVYHFGFNFKISIVPTLRRHRHQQRCCKFDLCTEKRKRGTFVCTPYTRQSTHRSKTRRRATKLAHLIRSSLLYAARRHNEYLPFHSKLRHRRAVGERRKGKKRELIFFAFTHQREKFYRSFFL